MNKKEVKNKAFRYLKSFVPNKTVTKISNITGKTGQYNVPDELFQKRTARKNRVLISWKSVKRNNLTLQHLKAFEGGVVVEFINDDYFNEDNYTDELFCYLIKKIGSDEIVSSMVSIRSEAGSSSSSIQRKYYYELVNNTEFNYKGERVLINENNLHDYAIKRKDTYSSGMGNDHWEGFIYISVKGGQQETIKSHNEEVLLFNPACEYLNEEISLELNLVIAYFTLHSKVFEENVSLDEKKQYDEIMKDLRQVLSECYYSSSTYKGTLLDYCEKHPSTSMKKGELFDPIQVTPIYIEDFAIDDKSDERNIDFTHDEAVNKDRYYWDDYRKTILSPARPTNVFWSKHLSNMMQQNFSLDEYFEHQEKIIERRNKLLSRK
ncbi:MULTISPECIES: hypothetical protein [Staphylococcus]|uniref:hypothetical protein n=1 Tax=Staphylococcus TaxID=1279 RepID=UPI00066B671A|nr:MULTISPECIES: hypothetical protein [Staphylococcus]MDU4504393.1 hypothetical protein [Staphylococcus warneri]HAY0978123.1 hypothetical protein [Staphylococcus aureus]MCK6072146.1 hypothetical protein [Staphylococcus epidermidis]MDH8803217.1 hypothetical protein [Staphylococcus epidermidis]MDS0964723.1 hypothetical protein [Staphylococcus epidermidis]